jgi:hypothetical protein
MNLALVCQGLVKWVKDGVTLQFKMDVVGQLQLSLDMLQ